MGLFGDRFWGENMTWKVAPDPLTGRGFSRASWRSGMITCPLQTFSRGLEAGSSTREACAFAAEQAASPRSKLPFNRKCLGSILSKVTRVTLPGSHANRSLFGGRSLPCWETTPLAPCPEAQHIWPRSLSGQLERAARGRRFLCRQTARASGMSQRWKESINRAAEEALWSSPKAGFRNKHTMQECGLLGQPRGYLHRGISSGNPADD